jgi:predicted MFS family arabinose efflux permease
VILDTWFWVGTVVCAVSLVVCVAMTFVRTFPDDFSILSIAAVELFVLVYGVGAIVRGAGGEPIQGELWEFWGYVITALIVPVVAFVWAVTDKTRWSNLVMAAVGPTIFVMLHRMQVIWFG